MEKVKKCAVLFDSIITSSIWSADDKTRIMWITLLALADEEGYVAGTIPGLSAMARMSLEDTDKAIKNLESPDPHSRTPDHEGRRIAKVDGGWLILNYKKYITKARNIARKQYMQGYMVVYRSRKKEEQTDNQTNEVHSQDTPKGLLHFDQFWKSYPRKVGKGAAKKAWIKNNCDVHIEKILKTLETYKQTEQWRKDNGQFIPHPSTWLNQERWEDEPENTTLTINKPIAMPKVQTLSLVDEDAIEYYAEQVSILKQSKNTDEDIRRIYKKVSDSFGQLGIAKLKKELEKYNQTNVNGQKDA